MDEQTPHPDYIKGFNEGYTLTKHMPELSEKLPQSLGDTERGQGFKAGREQYILEKDKQLLPSWLRSDRLSSLDKEDPEREKDKDDLERE